VAKLIGLFKELGDDERLLYETKDPVLAIFARELEVRKLMRAERREFNLVYATSRLYLSDKRLMLLALQIVESKLLLEHKAPRMSMRSGGWLEVPIKAVSAVELRSLDLKKDRDLARFLAWTGFEQALGRVPAVEVAYDGKQSMGRVRDYIDMVLEVGGLVLDQRRAEKSLDKLILVGEEVASEMLPVLKNLLSKTPAPSEGVEEEPLV